MAAQRFRCMDKQCDRYARMTVEDAEGERVRPRNSAGETGRESFFTGQDHRARGVPDRTVISSESRSLTGTPRGG
jgi:hypothetical protein